MKTEEFFNVLADIDDDMITKAKGSVSGAVGGNIVRRSWKPFAAAVACLAVVIIGAAVMIGVNMRRETIKNVNSGSKSQISDNSGKGTTEYPESAKYQYTGDFSELEPASYGMVDRIVFGTFDELAKASSLIVVGTFVDDARQDVPLTGKITEDPRSTSLLPGSSFNKLRVDRVFKGDIEAGSQIVIRGNYFVNEGRLVYVYGAASTPMIKGEQWVYFLASASAEKGDYYSSIGFNDGRFYVPGNENTFVLEELGEYLVGNNRAYEDVKIMLGETGKVQKYELEDKTSERAEFTMPEYVDDTFVWTPRSLYVTDKLRLMFNKDLTQEFYFADLTGDGKRELVFIVYSEELGNFIMAYDHANSKLYHLKEHLNGEEVKAPLDYGLDIKDGVLYACERSVNLGEVYVEKPLTLDLMTEVDLSDDPITYEGKTYYVTGRKYTEDGVTFTVGLTKSAYEAGEFVEVLGIVQNDTGKELGLKTNMLGGKDSHLQISTHIKQDDIELYDYDVYIKGMLFEMAIGSYIIDPGETFYQPMRFETCEARLDDKDTVIPLCKPLGTYLGSAYISIFKDPHNMLSKARGYAINFDVNITERETIRYPDTRIFTIDEFGDGVRFRYSDSSLAVKDASGDYELFTGMPMENMWLIDLNDDGKREIVANIIGAENGCLSIMAYDYANRRLYELSDPGYYDYRLSGELDYKGGYYLRTYKFKYATSEEVFPYFGTLTLDKMNKVTEFSKDKRTPLTGVTKITGQSQSFTMEEFPGKTFSRAERKLKYTDKNGDEKVLFNTKVENVYLYDMNADGRREIIVEGYSNVYIPETNLTRQDGIKTISVFDIENGSNRQFSLDPENRSLVIIEGALHFIHDGQTDTEPLTYERIYELAKEF